MKKILFLLLISLGSYAQRAGLIDADTTTRPKAGLSALAFNSGILKIVRPSGSSYNVITANNSYTNPSWINSIVIGKVTGLQGALDGKQPLDTDLTTFAGLTATTDNFLIAASSAWASRTPAQARTSLGATTIGSSMLMLTNPSAITFPRFNADNTVSALDAASFRTALGVGTGTVTSVALSVPAFLSVSGSPITGSGTFAIGYSGTALPAANGGSGQTTLQAAMNAFAGAVTSGLFLRGNGTNVVMGAIQAGDLPTAIDAAKLGGGAVSNTELSYVDGVTSAIQPQIDGKQPLDSDLTTFAGLTPTTDNFLIAASSAWASRTPAQARTSLGATTVGANLLMLTNPSAITFPRFNADNTVSSLDAASFRTAIGAGTSSTTGTVTSVAMSVPSFLSISGSPITGSGTFALTLSGTALPVSSGGSGQTTLQAAMNAFAGAVTSGLFLRGNGTNVVMGAIQAGDLPTAIDAAKLGDGSVSTTEYQYINSVTGNVQTQLDAKQPNVQFKDEASNVSTSGGITSVNFTGPSVTASNSGAALTVDVKDYESLVIAASDRTTAITSGTDKEAIPMPFAMTVTEVRAYLGTAQASGSIFTVDIMENGTSILSTKITIDNTENHSKDAVTLPVISDTVLAKNSVIRIDVTQIGNGSAKDLKVTIDGYRN